MNDSDSPPLDSESHPGGAGGAPAPEPIAILLVDDEPRNLTVLETILSAPEYRLVRAESADQALLALVAEEFALLILDIRMPGMSGLELAQLIKQRKKSAGIPIIFLTAYFNEDQHVLTGYETGAVDYLLKPIHPRVLRSKVQVFAELHRKNREAAEAQRSLREWNEQLEQRVTERTALLSEAHETLREANRRKDEFLAMLGHELRNPLAAISNAVQLLCDEGGASDQEDWPLGIIQRQSENLRRIVDELLDVARITRGQIVLRRQVADVGVVIQRAIAVVRPQMLRKRHLFATDINEVAGCLAEIDEARVEQSLVNVLMNAIKYTPEGGRITLLAKRDHDEAVIAVQDNGIGIDPGVLPSVFELFTQARHTLDRAEGGLGLGLNICRQLIELHGGRVIARSAGLGQGSEFVLMLPVEKGVPPRPEPRPPQARHAARSRRILVVDDNEDSARSLARLLQLRGHVTRCAGDGLSALEAAGEFQPEVFLLDLGLPGLDGYELARRLKAEGFEAAQFVAISGYAQENDVKMAREAGFDRHFAKPVSLQELSEVLQSWGGESIGS